MAFKDTSDAKVNESRKGPHPDCPQNVEFLNRVLRSSPWLSKYEIEVHDTVDDSIFNPTTQQHETVKRVKEHMYILFIAREKNEERERMGLKGKIITTFNVSFHQTSNDFQKQLIYIVNGLNK